MPASDAPKQILIADRDIAAVEPLRQRLGGAGFMVRTIGDPGAAAAAVAEQPPHLCILDWNSRGLPALEWLHGIRRARAGRAVRLIILSALAGEQHVVMGLNLGADDYILKPFSPDEAVARVAALLRGRASAGGDPSLAIDGLVLDAARGRVNARGHVIALRGVELRLLEFLMLHPGQAFNRAQLLAQVWGEHSGVDERTVDVNVQLLRKTLSQPGYEAYIQTVRGFGYRFAQPAQVHGL